MKTFIKRLLSNESGLTLPEYGIGLALAIGVGTAALAGLATEINGTLNGAGSLMPCTAAAADGTGGGSC